MPSYETNLKRNNVLALYYYSGNFSIIILTSLYTVYYIEIMHFIEFYADCLPSGKQRITSSIRRTPECYGTDHVQIPTTSGTASDC